jgi:ERAP1-like C-terminal domain
VFGSVTVVRFGCREPAASSFVEFRPARLRRVVLNGQELDPGPLRGNRLPLASLHEVNALRVEADMAYSRGSAGLHRFTDPADGETYLAVHAGLDSAQRVFAAFDQPDLKASIIATVTAPGSWTADPRDGHRARDGPHVVRRRGHHGLVERRVAERVVRHVPGLRGAVGGHRLHRCLVRLRPGAQAAWLRRSWLAAGHWPGGPDLDSRLRWQIMLRLTVLGAADRPEIEREAGRDTTFAGQQSAARCRAALPGLDARRAAWTRMFGPAPACEPSSYLLAATAEGFWQADQADLVAGYVARYFPALAEVTERRGPAVARLLVQHGFPHHAVAAATLGAGEEVLADAVFPASLRRLLADRLDDLRRALRVRRADVLPPGRGDEPAASSHGVTSDQNTCTSKWPLDGSGSP